MIPRNTRTYAVALIANRIEQNSPHMSIVESLVRFADWRRRRRCIYTLELREQGMDVWTGGGGRGMEYDISKTATVEELVNITKPAR
jgi:hypothetical protein